MSFGGLQQVADLYHESCAKYGNKPGRLMCSYFTHFADNRAQEDAQRARQIRYYRECVIPALPGDPKTAPPSYRYFVDMVARLQKVKPEDLTENSVLLGSPQRIIDTLKKVEAAGFRILLKDRNVKGIFINIFGGIVRCERIAHGVIEAAKEVAIKIPVVVRLQGTNAEEGRQLLQESGLRIEVATDLWEAAQKIVALTGRKRKKVEATAP